MIRLIAASLLVSAACGPGSPATGVVHGGKADPPPGNTSAPNGVAADEDVKVVNQPGALVTLDEVLVPGKVTVIDFFADWCGACKVMEKKLLEKVAGQTGIAIRKIDVKDDTSPVAKHYEVGALPHVRIYTRSGQMVYALTGNQAMRAGELALQVRERK